MIKNFCNNNGLFSRYVQHALDITDGGKTLPTFNIFPIIIYQAGKVASQSIETSLRQLNLLNEIHRLHILTEKASDGKMNSKRKNEIEFQKKMAARVRDAALLRTRIEAGKAKGERFKIITLVREPVGAFVSSRFENIENIIRGYNPSLHDNRQTLNLLRKAVIDTLYRQLENRHNRIGHHPIVTFFDVELKEVFNIDVYSKPFDPQKGYALLNNEFVDVLLIRYENINDCIEAAMKEFLGINNFELAAKNVGTKKNYSDLYKYFKKNVKFPRNVLCEIYKLKCPYHFYSEEERQALIDKWSQKKTLKTVGAFSDYTSKKLFSSNALSNSVS